MLLQGQPKNNDTQKTDGGRSDIWRLRWIETLKINNIFTFSEENESGAIMLYRLP